jgi:hypothetical protein
MNACETPAEPQDRRPAWTEGPVTRENIPFGVLWRRG